MKQTKGHISELEEKRVNEISFRRYDKQYLKDCS